MDKTVDLTRTIYEICRENPEVVEIMIDLGFENISNPAMLNTAGRFMTIPKGAAIKGIQLEKIKDEFTRRGYKIKE
ncbi:MAG: DUF1858 domain-containing protein [Bacillota bacterium]